ncbi:extracellular solute-binding protein [Paenibacillus alginolyticus]|uniref:Extracellular solute-binding protein n=1 Tax=Paenibacillus alginolyticus TaxID=59839 RepID=A0ABT4G5C8_9BACL|nr:extracellular solute-binding protein [Paenibacillus alginolyticus]MCY9691381.1 extracellular solute-binding protein [Paenibacillus alginolyticus]MEC0146489.1 extracellular solute-binding protein [Paenibacillus alginolyticus]
MSNQLKVWSYSALAALLAGTVTLAGCSKTGDPSPTTPASSASSASAAPKVEEPYELKWLKAQDISKPYDPSKDAVKQAVEKKLNIKITPEMVDVQQYKTKLNLKMSSGDIPDVVRIDFADDFQKYAQQGAFVDLTSLINEKDTPNILKEVPKEVFEQAKVNGKIYGIPYQGGPGAGYRWNVVLRKDYVEGMGAQVPKTLDEYYNLLKKVKAEKPDVIPLGGYTAQIGQQKYANNSFDHIFGAFGITPGYFTEKDGKFSNYDIDPKMKEALQYLQKMYAEGLIDKEFATIKEEQLRAKLYSGKLFSWMGWWSTPNDYDTQVETNELKKSGKLASDGKLPDQSNVPFKYLSLNSSLVGPDGKAVAPAGAPFGQMNAISAKTKDPKKVLAIIENSLSLENQMLTVWGIEGEDYKIDNGKMKVVTDLIDPKTQQDKNGNFRGIQSYLFAPGLKGWPRYLESLPLRHSQALDVAINNKFQITDASNYLDSPTKITKLVELNTLRDSVFTQIIMGADIKKFDEFAEKWKSQGGTQILTELEASFKKKSGK